MKIINDQPISTIENDSLPIKDQVLGFSDYIRTCETPLTISVQGKWGSGKTSFFQLVKENIENQQNDLNIELREDMSNCLFLTFNAWQYSQFNSDSELPVTLIASLVKQIEIISKDLSNTIETIEKIKHSPIWKNLKVVAAAFATIGNEVAKKTIKVDIAEKMHEISESYKDNNDKIDKFEEYFAPVEAIASLQNDFKECVTTALANYHFTKKNDNPPRMIIFIDDLDRLLPEKAINLLEVMKLFLDCPNCIFILAIDYDVVINGVLDKYKKSIDVRKANDYFEKMIQVVYRLPNAMSNMDTYIKTILQKYDTNISLAESFSDLIRATGKDNPRGVKRLLNNYYLIRQIGNIDFEDDTNKEFKNQYCIAVFSLICLQELCSDKNNENKNNDEFLKICSNVKNISDYLNDLYNEYHNKETHSGIISEFLTMFVNTLAKHTDGYSFCMKHNLSPFLKSNVIGVLLALNSMNYSEQSIDSFGKVTISVPPELFNNSHEWFTVALDQYPSKKLEKGTIEDAYLTTMSLVANCCNMDGLEELRNQLYFMKPTNTEKKVKIDCFKCINPKDDLYVAIYDLKERYFNCINHLANALQLRIIWFRNENDNVETAENPYLFGIDYNSEDYIFEDVYSHYVEYLNFKEGLLLENDDSDDD